MSSIFLSHSSRDSEAAAEMKARLEGAGHRSVFLDFDPADGIPAGRDWEQEIYRGICGCRAVIVLCSRHSMASKWCFTETAYGRALGKPLFPVRIDDCELDGVLSDRQAINLTEDREEGYEGLFRGLLASGLDPADAFDWDGSRSPYPGLMAFQEADAAVFFGRSGEIEEGLDVLNRVRWLGETGLVMVLGASGTGKSSLVRAGLLPRLRRDEDRWLVVAPFRPRDYPARELAGVLSRALGGDVSQKQIEEELRQAAADGPPPRMSDRPRQRTGTAVDADEPRHRSNPLLGYAHDLRLRTERAEARVLLVIDQFEELLGGTADYAASCFLRLLREAVEAPESPLLVLATMRSDFLASFQQNPALLDLRFETVALGPMSSEDIAQVIERPAEMASIDLESGLVQALVDDTETQDALPLLAFALGELYERCGKDKLLVSEYREGLGGLQGAVANCADDVLRSAQVGPEAEEMLRRAFLSMVRITEEGDYARRPASWKDLPTEIHPLLERFVRARLLISGSDGDQRTLEVAHEALFRSWGRLRPWLDQSAEALHFRREIEAASRSWDEAGRAREDLWRGGRLARAQELIAAGDLPLEGPARTFVEASTREEQGQVQAEADRRRRAFRLVVGGAIAALALATVSAGFWRRATQEASKARDRAKVAAAGEWLTRDPTRAALILLEVEHPEVTPLANSMLQKAATRPVATAIFSEHERMVTSALFDRDGSHVVTASHDGTARVWRSDGRSRPVILRGHTDAVTSAVFDPGGSRVVTGSHDGTARVWWANGLGGSVVLSGHEDVVDSAAFDASGTRVVTASRDGTARVWRADGTAEPVVLRGHTDWVTGAVFDPDGSHVVTGSRDGTTRVWSIDGTGEPVVLEGQLTTELGVGSVFDPGGDHVVTISGTGPVRVWRIDGTGEPVLLSGHTAVVTSAVFDADGSHIVTASYDGTARVWRADGVGDPVVLEGHKRAIWTAAFDPSGSHVVTASSDNTARIWRADGKGEPVILEGDESLVWTAAYDADGSHVVTASLNGAARVWDARAPGEPLVLEGHQNSVNSAVFDASGCHLVTASLDDTARVWRADGAGEPVVLRGHEHAVTSAVFDADGSHVATASEDGTARVWRADGEGEPVVLRGHDGEVYRAVFDPAGTSIATASRDGTARVWPADGIGAPVVLAGHTDALTSVVFDANGSRVATASKDNTARVWRSDGIGPPVVLRGHDRPVTSVQFDPDGSHVVTASVDGTVRVWRSDGTGDPVSLAGHKDAVLAAVFDADGSHVITASLDGTARVWRANGTGDPIVLRGHGHSLLGVALDRNGSYVVTSSMDRTARIWRIDGHGWPIVLGGHRSWVASAAFSPDGTRLVTASHDSNVRVWRWTVNDLLEMLGRATSACLDADFRQIVFGETSPEARERFETCERTHGRTVSAAAD